MANYQFSVYAEGVFPYQRVNPARLLFEVKSVPALDAKSPSVQMKDGYCDVGFNDELSAAEETMLSSIILVHQGEIAMATEVMVTATTVTNAKSYTKMPGMAITPVAGIYRVSFGTSIAVQGKNEEANLAIFVDKVLLPSSVRRLHRSSTNVGAVYTVNINELIAVNGSQEIEVRWCSLNGSSITGYERSLIATVSS